MTSKDTKQIEHTATVEGDDVPSEVVVRAIAQAKGISPLEMPALYDIVDPEALDAVLKGRDLSYVRFPFGGYTVTVMSDGRIIVRGCDITEE